MDNYSLNTKYTSLSTIDLDGIEYSRKDKKSVIYVNWGAILHKTPQFYAIVGDEDLPKLKP